MAAFPNDVRPVRASSLPQNRGQSSMRQTTVLGLLACVLAVGSMAAVKAIRLGDGAPSSPLFLSSLGAPSPSASLSRQPAKGVHVRIDRKGFAVSRKGSAVSIQGIGTS